MNSVHSGASTHLEHHTEHANEELVWPPFSPSGGHGSHQTFRVPIRRAARLPESSPGPPPVISPVIAPVVC